MVNRERWVYHDDILPRSVVHETHDVSAGASSGVVDVGVRLLAVHQHPAGAGDVASHDVNNINVPRAERMALGEVLRRFPPGGLHRRPAGGIDVGELSPGTPAVAGRRSPR